VTFDKTDHMSDEGAEGEIDGFDLAKLESPQARTCHGVAVLLGLAEPRNRKESVKRTMGSVETKILAFFKRHGRRPRDQDGFRNVDAWLMRRGSSIHKVCEKFGLPGGRNFGRTKGGIERKIRKFYDREGRRPKNREMTGENQWLAHHHKMSLHDLCDEMGLPTGKTPRTIKRVREEIQRLYDREGRRPTNKEMIEWVNFLRRRGTTLSKLCDKMGLPEGRRKRRSMLRLREDLQAFFNEHGSRPTNKEMGAWCSWLRAHHKGITLHGVCNDMGLSSRVAHPGKASVRLSKKQVTQEVQKFYDREKRRPMNKEVRKGADWLKRHDSSLRELCDEMGLPVDGYTMEIARHEVGEFNETHGHRPRHRDLPKLARWLRSQDISLPRLGEEMGFSAKRPEVRGRTMGSVRTEIRKFAEKYGRRPGVKDMQKVDGWLRTRGTNLPAVCDEMGYAPLLRMDRTEEEARKVVFGFYKENGKRPRKKDLPAWQGWLEYRGSSLRKFCDALGLPKEWQYSRTLEQARIVMMDFFKKHGHRPVQLDLQAWDGWLRNHHGSSVSKFCDELGLPKKGRNKISGVAR